MEGRGFDFQWFHWNFSLTLFFGRTVALGSTWPLTEMRTRNISWVIRQPVHRADNLTTFMWQLSRNLWASTSLKPLGL